jgi:hypothetical protein
MSGLRNRLVFSELNVRWSPREESFKPPFSPAVSAVLSGVTGTVQRLLENRLDKTSSLQLVKYLPIES